MAEISQDGGGKGKGGKKQLKKMSTRIDLTPMVDLGFLLITFFMLTTTLSKPKTMEIHVPVKDENADSTKIPEDVAMTIILGEKDRVFYYYGFENLKIEVTNFGKDGIGKVLRERNNPTIVKVNEVRKRLDSKAINEKQYAQEVGTIYSDRNALVVLIKSDDKATFKNFVDIMDEMKINSVGKYAIVDITDKEKEMIVNPNTNL